MGRGRNAERGARQELPHRFHPRGVQQPPAVLAGQTGARISRRTCLYYRNLSHLWTFGICTINKTGEPQRGSPVLFSTEKECREIPGSQQNSKERKIECEEQEHVALCFPGTETTVIIESNEACQGSDGRAQSADIDSDEQTDVILRESGKKDCRGHVGDDLTGKCSERKRIERDQRAEELLYLRDAGKIARKDKEGTERKEQAVVHV